VSGGPGVAVASAVNPDRGLQTTPRGAEFSLLPTLPDTVRSLASMLVLALFVLTFIVQPFRIPSESMEHTLLVGDFLLVNKQIFAPAGVFHALLPFRSPRRGDVVVFRFPLDPTEYVVKRVIGVPGDRIHLDNGTVVLNGVPQKEPYVTWEPAFPDPYRDNFPSGTYSDPSIDNHWWVQMHTDLRGGDVVVPKGQFFVMGDNRNYSRDSRYWGFVPRAAILGRPFLIYFSVREPSSTDHVSLPGGKLGQENGPLDRLLNFSRWRRMFKVVR
jgi:signal peptidase I